MKKLISLLCVAMIFMVSGCSDASADISDGNTMIMQVGSEKITKEDIYSITKLNSAATATMTKMTQLILDKEVPVTDAITKKAKEKLEKSKELYGSSFEETIKNYGYADEEDYYNKTALLTVRKQELAKLYITEQDTLSTFTPIKARVLSFESKDDADDALYYMNDEDYSYDDIVDDYAEDDSKYDGSTTVFHSDSGLPATLWEKITNTTDKGLINEVLSADIDSQNADGSTSTTTSYYIVEIIDTTLDNYKDDALDAIASTSSTIVDEAFVSYLGKYEFKIWDIDVYNGIKETKPDYLVQDK